MHDIWCPYCYSTQLDFINVEDLEFTDGPTDYTNITCWSCHKDFVVGREVKLACPTKYVSFPFIPTRLA